MTTQTLFSQSPFSAIINRFHVAQNKQPSDCDLRALRRGLLAISGDGSRELLGPDARGEHGSVSNHR